MKIWGTVSPWIELEQESMLMGRFVANNEFVKALFDYTDFDEPLTPQDNWFGEDTPEYTLDEWKELNL